MFMRREKYKRNNMTDAKKLKYLALHPENIHAIRIGKELTAFFFFIDKDNSYITITSPISIS